MRLVLPPLYTPIEPKLNPAVELVTTRGVNWMRQMGLATTPELERRVVQTESGEFAARVAPTAPPDLLQLLTDNLYLGFLVDDVEHDPEHDADFSISALTKSLRFSGAWLTALETGWAGPDVGRFGAATVDLWRRLDTLGQPGAVRRLATATRGWALAVCAQLGYSHSGRVPDVDTAISCRMLTSGGCFVSPFFELFIPSEVRPDDALMDSPELSRLACCSWGVATFDNDLFSYAKERRGVSGSTSTLAAQNVVAAVELAEGTTTRDAMERVAHIRNRVMVRYLRLRDDLHRTHAGHDGMRLLLDNYDAMIRGNLEWSLHCRRYSDPHHPDGPIEYVLDELVDPPDAEGSPIPALDWLWR